MMKEKCGVGRDEEDIKRRKSVIEIGVGGPPGLVGSVSDIMVVGWQGRPRWFQLRGSHSEFSRSNDVSIQAISLYGKETALNK